MLLPDLLVFSKIALIIVFLSGLKPRERIPGI